MTEMSVERCDSICAYVLPYHSIFLHTHFGKSGKCWLEPTQTATTSSILCRRHGPIWPKLERHVVSSPTCCDMSATFLAKMIGGLVLLEDPSVCVIFDSTTTSTTDTPKNCMCRWKRCFSTMQFPLRPVAY